MKLAIFLLSFAIFVSITLAKTKKSSTAKSKDVSAEENGLKRFRDIATYGPLVIPLGDGNFSKYISERPRLYTATIMFTALAAKYQCTICDLAVKNFRGAAAFYHEQYDFNSTSLENRMAFFMLDVDTAGNIFSTLGLDSVPRFFVLPSRGIGSPKQKMGEYEFDASMILKGPKYALEEISELSGIKV